MQEHPSSAQQLLDRACHFFYTRNNQFAYAHPQISPCIDVALEVNSGPHARVADLLDSGKERLSLCREELGQDRGRSR